MVFVVVKAHN